MHLHDLPACGPLHLRPVRAAILTPARPHISISMALASGAGIKVPVPQAKKPKVALRPGQQGAHLSATTPGQGFTLGHRCGLREQSASFSQYLLPQHLPRALAKQSPDGPSGFHPSHIREPSWIPPVIICPKGWIQLPPSPGVFPISCQSDLSLTETYAYYPHFS